jgi:hypothetical protein
MRSYYVSQEFPAGSGQPHRRPCPPDLEVQDGHLDAQTGSAAQPSPSTSPPTSSCSIPSQGKRRSPVNAIRNLILAERLRTVEQMVTRDELRSVIDLLDAFIAKAGRSNR